MMIRNFHRKWKEKQTSPARDFSIDNADIRAQRQESLPIAADKRCAKGLRHIMTKQLVRAN